MKPLLYHPLLQASRLEEWLSDVVRAAYMQRLNGMAELETNLLLAPSIP